MQVVSREVALQKTLEYFDGDELASQVWVNKYSLKDSAGNLYESTPTDMHWRIANELARVDLKYPNPKSPQEYFDLMDRFKYIVPQGSPMSGIGNNLQIVSLSNCYVIGNEGQSDSYGGIMKTDQEQVQLMKRRAGVGHDLSHIRPKGSPVKNSALTSTGVVPFMERYSNSTREVAQDGRRGALMLSIDISHPDVVDFIDAKMELGKVTGANISVKITDDWMVVVERTTEDDVIRYKELLNLIRDEIEDNEFLTLKNKIIYTHTFDYNNGSTFTRELIAKEVFDKLVYNAWKSAEPGSLFWSQILRESIAECYSKYGFANVSTNPCMVGDTKVFTNKGWVSFKLLTEWFNKKMDIKILTTDKDRNLLYSEMEFCGVTNQNDDIYKISFTNGRYFLVNDKHKLYDTEYNQRLCVELKSGDVIRGYLDEVFVVDEVVSMGYKEDVYDLTVRPNLNFFALYDIDEVYFEDTIKVLIGNENDKKEFEFYPFDLIKTEVGLQYAIDVYTQQDGDVLYEANLYHPTIITPILHVDCGEIPLNSGDSCRLTLINLYSYVERPFSDNPTFNYDKLKDHSKVICRVMDNIVDLELEKINSILQKIDNDPEEEEVKTTERNLWLMIKKRCEQGRRTGAGVTAEGDMIAGMNLKYGTKEATEFATNVHKIYAVEYFRESVNLAKDRGHFPIWEWELEKENPYIQRVLEFAPEIKEDLLKYGRRNIAMMTIAPAGSVSCLTQTTSGIEPAFMVYYTRRRKINPNDKNVRVDFVDVVGDSWEEYNVFHHKFVDWYIAKNPTMFTTRVEYQRHLELISKSEVDVLIEQSPYHQAMANDVDWLEKVRMQGGIQKWVDHSISVTINLPNDATVELISQLYLEAWKSGCKGVTVYRDGSRSGVLISSDDNSKNKKDKEDFGVSHAPKRPKTLDCDIVHFTNKGEKWIAFIGLLEGRPYEIFTGNLTKINLPSNIEKGEITKHKGEDGVSNYDLYYYTGEGTRTFVCNIKDIFNSEFNDISRMVSAILRHGMPVGSAINLLASLNLDGDLINTWKNGVKRILKRYLKDEEIVEVKGKTCSNCGSINIMMIEGCETCAECGSSKCN